MNCSGGSGFSDSIGNWRLGIAALLVWQACFAAHGQSPAALDAGGYAITHVNVVDVRAGEVRPDQNVLVQGRRISRMGPAAEMPVTAEAKVVDGRGLYLMPGLIDAHVHYIDPESYGRLMIANGVTFVRDMGGATEQILALRDQLSNGTLLGPEMIATGAIVDGKPAIWPFSEPCDTPDEGRAAVAKLADAGVDQIKVYSVLKPEVFRAVVEAAHKRGLRAVGHVPESVPVEDAMKAGQDCCEHLTGFGHAMARLAGGATPAATQAMDSHIAAFKAWRMIDKIEPEQLAAFCKQVRDSGMAQCPTLVVFQGMARMNDATVKDDPYHAYLPQWMTQFWSGGRYGEFGKHALSGVPHMKKLVGAMHKAGVSIMVGTDLANPYVFAGRAVHEEMKNLTEAGLSATDALRAATIVPATFFGVSERIGCLSAGATASMVLVRANPLTDISNTQKIESVFLKGRYFARADLDKLLDEARQAAAGTAQAASGPAEDAPLAAPGVEILRGRYVSTFNGMDAGDERFVITRTDDGFYIVGHTRPKGWGQPFRASLKLDKKYSLLSAEWKQLTETPTIATYAVEAATLKASAKRGEKELKPQSVGLSGDWIISGPITAADFMSNNAVSINIGESRSFTNHVFGYPDWRWQSSKVSMSRKEDSTYKHRGKELPVRKYAAIFDVPNMGQFNVELLVDERGITLKSTVKMPYGKIENTLE